jgi:hypothetical protein
MNEALVVENFDKRVARREGRRQFFRAAGIMAGGAAGVMALNAGGAGLMASAMATTPAISDGDILNFALNLEYLEAQFYSFATTGHGLPSNLLTGTGNVGQVLGGAKVPFTDKVVKAYANEIARDEMEHVAFLRSALGSYAVAQPTIDIGGQNPNGAFSTAARAAGLVGAGQAFNPYADDISFLFGAFIFEDVGVTAYKGAAPLITSKAYLEAAAGILAAEAYHASLIRTTLFQKGQAAPSIIFKTNQISVARDSLDGPSNDDQGITLDTKVNIVPLDSNGLAYSRSTGQVLNVVYLNPNVVMRGGFFPAGVNGVINTSAASA